MRVHNTLVRHSCVTAMNKTCAKYLPSTPAGDQIAISLESVNQGACRGTPLSTLSLEDTVGISLSLSLSITIRNCVPQLLGLQIDTPGGTRTMNRVIIYLDDCQ